MDELPLFVADYSRTGNTGSFTDVVHGYSWDVPARRHPTTRALVGLVVGALLVVALGLSMLAAHGTEKLSIRSLQPMETMMVAETHAQPPFACTRTQSGSSGAAQNGASGAEITTSLQGEQREAACLYKRRLLSRRQLSTLNTELRATVTTSVTTWFPLSAQISPSAGVLGFWSVLIAAELFGVAWLVRRAD